MVEELKYLEISVFCAVTLMCLHKANVSCLKSSSAFQVSSSSYGRGLWVSFNCCQLCCWRFIMASPVVKTRKAVMAIHLVLGSFMGRVSVESFLMWALQYVSFRT
jgi:hypothetical protein